jgi:DNA-binding CsgD family transcriptional regulator
MKDLIKNITIKVRINPSYEWDEGSRNLGISHRELEVLALMIEGFKNKEIAEILHIKHQSVKNHMHELNKKLDVKNGAQAMMVALLRKLITIDSPAFPSIKPWIDSEKLNEDLKRIVNFGDPNVDEKARRFLRVFLLSHGIDVNK